MKKINILFVHPQIGNAYELFKSLNKNEKVNAYSLLNKNEKVKYTLYSKIKHKLRLHEDIYKINKKLLSYNLSIIDSIIIVKGNEIYPSTLKKIKRSNPNIKLLHWSLDDMTGWHTKSIFTHFGLKYYDIVYTTKSYNIKKLKKMHVKNIKYITQAYSNKIHKNKVISNKKFTYDVLFIGRAEKERFETMKFLAKNGIKINIYGTGWDKSQYNIKENNLILHNKGLYNEDYSLAISNSKITLSFLSKINNDLHTSRSVEIPACGGFMIAERTSEHLELFKENEEAVYFDTNEELLDKIKFYLNNEQNRLGIIKNALKRCKTSDYSYDNMANKIITDYIELKTR